MLTTAAEIEEFKRCAASFPYFLDRYVYMRTGGGEKFVPWPWQHQLAEALPRFRRAIFLKGRQIGMSWLLDAYALHVALFEPGSDVLLISQTDDDAKELLAKLKFIFEMLPDFLKPTVGKDNTQVLAFPGLHSQVKAMTSTERSGRGYTGRLILADEHAFHQWAEANLAATDPAIDAGGQFLSLSSANGIGNLFADQCAKSTKTRPWLVPELRDDGAFAFPLELREVPVPEQGWLPFFLPFSVRPGRDEAWWEKKKDTYPRAWMIHQEFPRDPEEAFVQTGRPVFLKERMDLLKPFYREPLSPELWPAAFAEWSPEELRIFDLPQEKHRYLGGADVAEGLEHGDYSDLSVVDVDAGERPREVLSLHGHWDPDQFAEKLDQVARIYRGIYGIERNNHGHAVLLRCKRLGTPGIYRERPQLTGPGIKPEPGKLGWLTNKTTKPILVDDLVVAIRELGILWSDRLAYPEFVFYQTNDDGSTGAPSGQWDDRVMSRAILYQMLKRLPEQRVQAESGSASHGVVFGGGLDGMNW